MQCSAPQQTQPAIEAVSKSLHAKPPLSPSLPSTCMAATAPAACCANTHNTVHDVDEQQQLQLHVVMVPYPLQGHINPMVQFAKALVAKHPCTRVTIVNTKHNHDRIQQTRLASVAPSTQISQLLPENSIHPPADHQCTSYKTAPHQDDQQMQVNEEKLQFLWVDDGLPRDFDYTDIAPRLRDFHFATTYKMKEPLKQLLQSLNQKRPSISCVVFGSFFSCVHPVCIELGIPLVCFWTQSAAVFSIYHHLPLLEANGFFPYNKDAPSGCHVNDDEKSQEPAASREMVPYVPGVPPLYPSSFPTLLHVDSLLEPSTKALKEQFAILADCKGVIVNSYEELEKDACQALQAELPFPVSLVGPLIPSAFLQEGEKNDTSIGASLLQEQRECIAWLNNQKRQSVLYISFGSLLTPPAEDLQSIACGIRASKQPFLWVIRPTASLANVADILLENFIDGTKDYGLIIPWAPQVQVLSHPSVGAFLTHCGWNSTLESLSMGVPMIPFPIFSDQTTNCAYICDVWKVGRSLKRQGNGKVTSIDVERVVRAVLEEEGGGEMRKRACELREAARWAVGPQGSSGMYMDNFILSMRKKS